MKYMAKIAVVGEKDSIIGFKSLGLPVFPIDEESSAAMLIHRLARERYAVIFITESCAAGLEETLERYRRTAYPSIILIPGNQGSLGIGMRDVKKNVEKAIGVDILFGGND